jgi:signal transduction histidine kinase
MKAGCRREQRCASKCRHFGSNTSVAFIALFALQTTFIGVLLVEPRRRQRANQALDRLNAELEERIAGRTAALDAKTRELEAFAYSVAHDLKAPLRGIDGYSRLLLEDYAAKLGDQGRSFLETIRTSTEEMSQLIEDLLDRIFDIFERLNRTEDYQGTGVGLAIVRKAMERMVDGHGP